MTDHSDTTSITQIIRIHKKKLTFILWSDNLREKKKIYIFIKIINSCTSLDIVKFGFK